MKQIKVFVSSTFKDMQAERDLLMYQVAPTVNEVLNKHGIHVQFVDLRWGIDTKNCTGTAQDHHVLNRCIDEIRQSRPFFIGMLGDRYGWIPSEQTWHNTLLQLESDEASQVSALHQMPASVTELEFILGALMDKKLLRRSLFLFRDLAPAAKSAQGYQRYVETNEIESQKLDELKTRIQEVMSDQMLQKHLVEYDADLEGDTIKVSDTFVEQAADFLIREITLHEIDNISSPEKQNTWDEVLALEQDFEDKQTSSFQGRTKTLQEIQHSVDQKKPVLIIGHAGTGRSALVAQHKALVEAKTETIVLAHYAEVSTHNFTIDFMCRKWIYQMSHLVDMPPIPSELDYSIEELQAYLHKMIKLAGKEVTLIVDGLEQLIDIEHIHTMHKKVPSAHLIYTIESKYMTCMNPLIESKQVNPFIFFEQITDDEILKIIQHFSRIYSKEINPVVIQALVDKYQKAHHCPARLIWLLSMLHHLVYFTMEDYAIIEKDPADSAMLRIILYQLSIIEESEVYPERLFVQRLLNIPAHMEDVRLVVYLLGTAPKGLYRKDLTSLLTTAGIHASLAISNAISWFGNMITEHAYDGRITIAHSCFLNIVYEKNIQMVNNLYDLYLRQLRNATEKHQHADPLVLDALTELCVKCHEVNLIPVLFSLGNPYYLRGIDRLYWLLQEEQDHVLTWINKGLEAHPVIAAQMVCALSQKTRGTGEKDIQKILLKTVVSKFDKNKNVQSALHNIRINTITDMAHALLEEVTDHAWLTEEEKNEMKYSALILSNDVLSCAMQKEDIAQTPLRTQHRVLTLAYKAGSYNLKKIDPKMIQYFLERSAEIGNTLMAQKEYAIVKQHTSNHMNLYYLTDPSVEEDEIKAYAYSLRCCFTQNPRLQIQHDMLRARYTTSLLYDFMGQHELAETMQTFIIDELKALEKHKFVKFAQLMADMQLETSWVKGQALHVDEIDEDDLENIDEFVRYMHTLLMGQGGHEALWTESSWSLDERINMGIWAYLHHYHEIGNFIYSQLAHFAKASKESFSTVEWAFLKLMAAYLDEQIDAAHIVHEIIMLHKKIKQEASPSSANAYSPEYFLANRFIALYTGLIAHVDDDTVETVWSFASQTMGVLVDHSRQAMEQAKQKLQQNKLLYGEAYLDVEVHTQYLALYDDMVHMTGRITGTNKMFSINNKQVYKQATDYLSFFVNEFKENVLDRYGYYQTQRQAYEVLSDCYSKLGQPSETLFYLQKNSLMLHEICQLYPDNIVLRRDYAISLDHIGNWLLQQHNDKENAYMYIKEATPTFDLLYQEDPDYQFDNYLVNRLLKHQLEVELTDDKAILEQVVQEMDVLIKLIDKQRAQAHDPNAKIATLLDATADAYFKLGDQSAMLPVLQQARDLFKEIYVEKAQDGPALRDYLKSTYRMMHYVGESSTLAEGMPLFIEEFNQVVTTPPREMQERTLRIWMMVQGKITAFLANPAEPVWATLIEQLSQITEAVHPHFNTERSYLLLDWMAIIDIAYTLLDSVTSKQDLSEVAHASYTEIINLDFAIKKPLLNKSLYTWEELKFDEWKTRGQKLELI